MEVEFKIFFDGVWWRAQVKKVHLGFIPMWHDIWLNGQRKWHSKEQAVWAADCYVKDRALTEQGAQYYTADRSILKLICLRQHRQKSRKGR